MLGNSDKNIMGLSILTIQGLFNYIKMDNQNDQKVIISYVEIYNETIRDLLVP